MEVARVYTIKLGALLAIHNYSSKQFTMFTPAGPRLTKYAGGTRDYKSDYNVPVEAQPTATARSTNQPYPVTRKDTEDLLEQIADDFYNSAATLHEESKSRVTLYRRHDHPSKQGVLHSLAECAYNARNYSISGNDTYLQGALDSFTKAHTLNRNGIAAEEMNWLRSTAFSAFSFRHRNMPGPMIFQANSKLPKKYFDEWIQRCEFSYHTCTSAIIADLSARNNKTPCE